MTQSAGSIMIRAVITASPDETVGSLLHCFQSTASAVPVCDKEGALLLAEGTDLAPEFVDYLRLDKRIARDLIDRPSNHRCRGHACQRDC